MENYELKSINREEAFMQAPNATYNASNQLSIHLNLFLSDQKLIGKL